MKAYDDVMSLSYLLKNIRVIQSDLLVAFLHLEQQKKSNFIT